MPVAHPSSALLSAQLASSGQRGQSQVVSVVYSSIDDSWMLDLMNEPINRYRVRDRVVTYCNAAWADHYGMTKRNAIGRRLDDFLSTDELDGMRAQLALIGPDNPVVVDDAARVQNGDQRWLEWVDHYVVTDEGPEVLSVGRDVTERHLAERRVTENERRFRSLADAASDIVWRVRTTPSMQFDYLSPSTEKILGYPPAYFMADFNRIIDIAETETQTAIRRVISGERLPARIDFRFRHAHGHLVIGESTSSRSSDGIQGVVRDVTEVRHLQASLATIASTDSLTGLANRRAFEKELRVRLNAAHASNQTLAIVYLDLDSMKTVNDLHGHGAGDTVLQETARRLAAAGDGSDFPARLGGDEFAIIRVPRADSEQLWISRLEAALAEPIELSESIVVSAGASIGTATTDVFGYDPSELLAAADRAMYDVKNQRIRRRSR